MTFNELFEALFFGPPIQQGPGLPDPPAQRKPAAPAPSSGIKYTIDGIPYVEQKPEGHEVSSWNLINADTAKSAGRSKLGTDAEIAEGVRRGFSAETVALVRLHWADNKKQAAIAKATGLSIDTIKKITPIFSKGGER